MFLLDFPRSFVSLGVITPKISWTKWRTSRLKTMMLCSRSTSEHFIPIDSKPARKILVELPEYHSDNPLDMSANGTLEASVYRKRTHTDRLLSSRSNHPKVHKISCVRTLFIRVRTHCNNGTAESRRKWPSQVSPKQLPKKIYEKNHKRDEHRDQWTS